MSTASTNFARQIGRAQGQGRGRVTGGRGSRRRGYRGHGGKSGRGQESGGRNSQKEAHGNGGRGRNNNRQRRPIPPLRVVSSDFASMHVKCRAARYKVHKPRCDCAKITGLNLSNINMAGTEKEENGADSNGKTTSAGVSSTFKLDGLVVLPEVKQIRSVYLCLNTGFKVFNTDPRQAELKLKDELFPPTKSEQDDNKAKTDETDENDSKPNNIPNFKVSCASCLLSITPNGFACVSSSSLSTVELARDMARKRATWKQKEGMDLHADHAHFICALSRQSLWKLETAKNVEKKLFFTAGIYDQMRVQGLPVPNSNDDVDCEQLNPVDIGHHLSSLLRITCRDSDYQQAYWLVIVYDDRSDKKRCWSIDLPGGKRHLGETAWEGAVRETEEECSLLIDSSWVVGEGPKKSRRQKDDANVYYMLCPPASLVLDDINEDSFWSKKGLGDGS